MGRAVRKWERDFSRWRWFLEEREVRTDSAVGAGGEIGGGGRAIVELVVSVGVDRGCVVGWWISWKMLPSAFRM